MDNNVLNSDEYIKIYAFSNDLYIESLKSGMPVKHLNSIITSHREFQITDFNAIKDAINKAPQAPKKFGQLKEKITITISDDGLKATITYNVQKSELDFSSRETLVKESYEALNKKGITYGIKREFFFSDIEAGKTYTIAEGEASVDGKDSIIKMYELSDLKPEINEDGKANYYELKLINKVNAGDWLGERIEAKEGFPGRTVTGKSIKAAMGKNFPLNYDKNSVYEILQNGKISLYSKINGAVNYIDDKITVSNHLEIDGDVDFNTGNIKFDGYVTIKGTVADGFSVEATRDIEISSPIGIGNVKEIRSLEGSIFIRGGIVSKGQTEICAKNDIFTKFVDNATLTCGGLANIGFYCINSTINSNEVFVESSKGSIIGGYIKALTKVTSAVIGSTLEVKTIIEVTGFDRKDLTEKLESVVKRIENLKNEQQSLKKALSASSQKEMNALETKIYNKNFLRLIEIRDTIKVLELERKNLNRYLRTKGEGEITISSKIYPNCILILSNIKEYIRSCSIATSLYISEGELKQV
jgi:uncharacterized protein (DUF342 family)